MFKQNKDLTLTMFILAIPVWAYVCLELVIVVTALYPLTWFLLLAGAVAGLRRWVTWKPAPRLTAHGTARWANVEDLRKAQMLGGDRGLILGRLPGDGPGKPLVRMPNAVHSVIFAPVGAGKSTGIAIPYLLDGTRDQSAVVIDLKGELALATAAERGRQGHNIVILDPYQVVCPKLGIEAACFNPLDSIFKDSSLALDDCDDLAKALVVRTGEERETHWLDSAEKFISAFAAAVVVHGTEGKRSLQEVASLLSHPQKLEATIELMMRTPEWGGLLCRRGAELLHYTDKEKSSVLTTCSRFLGFLNTPAMAACTRTSSFRPAYLKRGLTTVYLTLPPERMSSGRPWLRSGISSMMRAVVHEGLYERPYVHFLLDEAASLGQMDCLEDLVDKLRGYGCRAVFMYQAVGQLKSCWPKDQGQTLLANASKIFIGTNDYETAKLENETLGKYTQVVSSGSQGWNGGRNHSATSGTQSGSFTSGGSSGWSDTDNWAQAERALLQPDEILRLPPRTAITFPGFGIPPVMTRTIRHYEPEWRQAPQAAASGPGPKWKFALAAAVLLVGLLAADWVQRLKLKRVDAGVSISKRALEIVEQERQSGKAWKPVKAAKPWQPPRPLLVISPSKRGERE